MEGTVSGAGTKIMTLQYYLAKPSFQFFFGFILAIVIVIYNFQFHFLIVSRKIENLKHENLRVSKALSDFKHDEKVDQFLSESEVDSWLNQMQKTLHFSIDRMKFDKKSVFLGAHGSRHDLLHLLHYMGQTQVQSFSLIGSLESEELFMQVRKIKILKKEASTAFSEDAPFRMIESRSWGSSKEPFSLIGEIAKGVEKYCVVMEGDAVKLKKKKSKC